MTRSFDRRRRLYGATGSVTRQCWPEIDWDAVDAKRKEDDLSRDCMCEKNDPDCKNCWVGIVEESSAAQIRSGGSFEKMHNPYVGSPYIGDVARSGPVGVATAGAGGAITLSPTAPVLTEFERDVRNRFDECLELLLRKHSDYGPANIANAPGGALNGLRVRLHDKLARINHLYNQEGDATTPQFESMRDSFLDLANYSVIALCVLDERWPTE